MTLDPHRFRDLPLLTRETAQDDYSVMIDGFMAGRIMLRQQAFRHELVAAGVVYRLMKRTTFLS